MIQEGLGRINEIGKEIGTEIGIGIEIEIETEIETEIAKDTETNKTGAGVIPEKEIVAKEIEKTGKVKKKICQKKSRCHCRCQCPLFPEREGEGSDQDPL